MSHPYAVSNSTSTSSYQSYDYDSQPSYPSARPARQPPPASPPPAGLPPRQGSTSASSEAGRYRNRGESSPSMQGYGMVNGAHEREGYFGAEGLNRRPSSGQGERPRRVNPDGTEETREQRRERKERKERDRATRGLTASVSLSHQRSSPQLGRPYPHSSSSPTSSYYSDMPPLPSTSTTDSIPRPVLTVALQRAQSAVLLDSANNVPAAIAAYQQSVRLLREVMRRVEEGTRRERESQANRDGRRLENGEEGRETSEERDQRIARAERRERAKQDEARRLEVIHNTYEERIKMLLAMPNATDPTAEPDTPATPTSPSSATTFQPSPTSPTTFSTSRTPQQHRTSRSITSLNTVTTAPATFAYQSSAPAPAVVVKGYSLEPEEDEADQAAEGIGAMMLGAAPVSPMVESAGGLSPTLGDDRAERNGSVSSQGTITAGQAFALHQNGRTSSTPPPPQSQLALDHRAPADDFLEFSPTSAQSHSSNSPTVPSIELSQAAERAARQRSESSSSVESNGPEPVTALEYGADWPASHSPVFQPDSPADALGDEPRPAPAAHAFEGISTDASVPEPQRSSLIGRDFATFLPTSANMGRSSSAQTAASAQTMQRLASSESMARQASGESFMSGRTSASLFSGREFPGEPRPARPSRSVSLQGPVPGVPVMVNPSMSGSAISQRRSRPAEMARTGSNVGMEGLQREPVVEEEEADDTVRLSHGGEAWEQQPNEFGNLPQAVQAGSPPPSSSGPGSFISASLPTRIRALSQPGKRPSLMQSESERPAMPTMLAQTARSVSVSGASVPRKMSFGGSTLHAPYPALGRTGSGSSVGTGGGDGTPLTAHFGNKAGYANGGVNLMLGPPALNPAELAPVAPVRRPFQLMKLLLASITQGAHLSARLYVPKQAWTLSGVKLVQVESKVRMLELLSDTLAEVNEAGLYLLPPPSGGPAWEGYRADPANRAKFLKALEGLEGEMDSLQASLHKKLGDAVAPSAGKKAPGAGFAAWGSKLSRSLDRVTNGRALDSPAAYVDALARVFGQAQKLDGHLVYLLEGEAGYEGMDEEGRRRVEARLRRASEFFSQTVCRFVLRDVGMLMDKYLKRQGNQICAE